MSRRSSNSSKNRPRPSGPRAPRLTNRVSDVERPLSQALLPSAVRHTLRYHTQIQLTPTTTLATYQFRLNSMYDTDLTGTGHQPMGFDQLMALYSDYWVISSSITVNAHLSTNAASIAATGANRVIVAFFATPNDTTLPSTVDSMMENHRPRIMRVSGYTTDRSMTVITDHPQVFGVSKVQYLADDAFGGGTSSNPVKWVLGNIAVCSSLSGTDTSYGPVDMDISIVFNAIIKGTRVLSSS